MPGHWDITLSKDGLFNKESHLINKNLAEADLGRKTGVIVIAIKNSSGGDYRYNPTGNTIIKDGDILIVLGSTEQIESIKKICCA